MTRVEAETTAGVSAAPATGRPRRRLLPWQATLLSLGVIAIAFAVPLRGLLRSQGPPMEEGFMLVFPEMVLHGRVANHDFLYLYGPGSLWVLAAVFKVFGTTLLTERVFGLVQQIGIVLGVYGIARFWDRTTATLCGLISLVIIVPPIGLTALPWPGAVALGLLGVVAALHGRRHADERRGGWWCLLGGILAGFSLLYRPDLVIAIVLAGIPIVRGLDRHRRRLLLIGAGVGVAPYVIHLAMAGVGHTIRGLVLDPVIYLRGGRRLPIPPPPGHLDGFLQRAGAIQQLHWPIPALRASLQLTIWFFFLLATVVFLVVVAWRARRRDPSSWRARVLMVAALFSVGITPQALQRVDSAHFAWVSCVPVALLPLAIREVLDARAPTSRTWLRALASGGVVLLFLVLVIPYFTARTYTDYSAQTFGVHRLAWKIEHDGRVFYYGRPDVADAAKQLLAQVDRVAKPGDHLLVGTTDLRKTPYSDAYLYYLLPSLRPSTYYIEMDPGVANRKGSKLAGDVAHSDIVILSSVWNDWSEPNDSRKFGSDVPNQVLRRDFCLVGKYGGDLYELYQKCSERAPARQG